MEKPRKPLWLLTEENITKSNGIYKSYWLAFKKRHPEFYDVPGAPKWENPYIPPNLRTREFIEAVQPKKVSKPLTCKRCNSTWAPGVENRQLNVPNANHHTGIGTGRKGDVS